MNIQKWMAWEGGVDLVAVTEANLTAPNIIVHVARMVHTPVGSAPSGMILWQPDAAAPPQAIGFVSSDPKVGAYFGANIFAGTPFEQAPVITAKIEITTNGHEVHARVEIPQLIFETTLSNLTNAEIINRPPAAMSPFQQQGLEQAAATTKLLVNGKIISHIVPPAGISGGPAAVFSACGIYAR